MEITQYDFYHPPSDASGFLLSPIRPADGLPPPPPTPSQTCPPTNILIQGVIIIYQKGEKIYGNKFFFFIINLTSDTPGFFHSPTGPTLFPSQPLPPPSQDMSMPTFLQFTCQLDSLIHIIITKSQLLITLIFGFRNYY